MFCRASLQHHLVCVSRAHKKSLKAALHHPLDVNRYKADASELEDPDDVEQDAGVKEDDHVRSASLPHIASRRGTLCSTCATAAWQTPYCARSVTVTQSIHMQRSCVVYQHQFGAEQLIGFAAKAVAKRRIAD